MGRCPLVVRYRQLVRIVVDYIRDRVGTSPGSGNKDPLLSSFEGRGFGVGSKAVVAGVEVWCAVRLGVTSVGSGLGVGIGVRG